MSDSAVLTVALSATSGQTRSECIHLLPSGTFTGRDGRGPWRLDNPDAFIAATFQRSNGQPIPIDYDHALVAAAEHRTPAPAAGWINKLDARPHGIWGHVEWTPAAAEHLAKREYRFISPVFRHTIDGEALSLQAAALTNQPALNLTAICGTERAAMATDLDQLCRELRPLLGLTEAAPPDAIVEAVKGLQTRFTAASTSPAADKFVPMSQFVEVVSALNAANSKGVSEDAAEIVVDMAIEQRKLMPALRTWAISVCAVDKPAFDRFLQNTSGGIQRLFEHSPTRGREPPKRNFDHLDREIAGRLGLSTDDYK